MTNNLSEILIFSEDEVIGIEDLRFIGYYKVKQSTIKHHLQHYYKFTPLQPLCEEFNKLTNPLKKEQQLIFLFS